MQPFEFTTAPDIQTAILGSSNTDARLIAGGTTLLDLMKLEVETPKRLLDIHRLPLTGISVTESGGLRIGALATNSAVAYDAQVKSKYPILAEAILAGASAQLRNMATVGGNLMQRTRCTYFRDPLWACNKRQPGTGCSAQDGHHRNHAILGTSDACFAAHPSDMAVALIALDATVEIEGAVGKRAVPIAGFHLGPGNTPEVETVVKPGELITAVELPVLTGTWRSHYLKVRDRASYEFALVSVAAMVQLEGSTIRACRLAFGGVATKPWRATSVEQLVTGQTVSSELFQKAADAAIEGAVPRRDNRFKVALLRRSVIRALETVTEGAK